VTEKTLLINRDWVDASAFSGCSSIEVDSCEPYAANALRIGETVLYAAAYPRTRKRLEAHGIDVYTVDVSELAKAEGAVTCCSLVFGPPAQ
jgi:dimethylargininase